MIIQDAVWLQLRDGSQFFPLAPTPESISIDAIAYGLARIYRFGGQTSQAYSVAEHCVRVSRLLPDRLKLAGLLHDAHEALSGFGDVASPVKKLAPVVKEIEGRIDRAIAERFGFDVSLFYDAELKRADLLMRAAEKRDLLEDGGHAWQDDCDASEIGEIHAWPPIHARMEFLSEFRRLTIRLLGKDTETHHQYEQADTTAVVPLQLPHRLSESIYCN
jgi:hypothetical protein